MISKKYDNGKVVLINNQPFFSGTGKYASDVYYSMSGNAMLINTVENFSDEKYFKEGYKFTGLKGRYFVRPTFFNTVFSGSVFKSAHSLINSLREKGAIIHFCNPMIKPVDTDRYRDIITIHDTFFLDHNFFFNKPKNLIFRKYLKKYLNFDHIIVPSNVVKEHILQYKPCSKVDVIYNPVSSNFHSFKDKNAIRKKLGLPTDGYLLLSIGKNTYQKNLSLIKPILLKLGSKYRLIRVGDALNTPGEIVFSKISIEFLNLIYNASDVLLNPSLYEGFGYTNLEAMATDTAIVASNIPVYKEIVADAGILSDPNNVLEFAEAVKEAVETKENLVKLGRRRVLEFSFQAFSRKMEQFYCTVSKIS